MFPSLYSSMFLPVCDKACGREKFVLIKRTIELLSITTHFRKVTTSGM